jgi:hypothetical protein
VALGIQALVAVAATADIVQPVSLQLKEQEPGLFQVQWLVPKIFPVAAMPTPVLPESCRAKGDRTLLDQPAAWLSRQLYRCPDGLAGRQLGVRYPFVNAAQTTLLRVDLLSGEQLVHVLGPGEEEWQVPDVDSGSILQLWRRLRGAVLDGGWHFLSGWLHLALLLAMSLLGGARTSVRLATAFAAMQLVAVTASAALGWGVPAALAEGGLAVAVVLLAREGLRPPLERRQPAGIAAVAGLVHGGGLVNLLPQGSSLGDTGWLYLVPAVVGMDATLLVFLLVAARIGRLVAGRSWSAALARGLSYGLGGAAVAGAVVSVLIGPPTEVEAKQSAVRLPTLSGAGTAARGPGSRALAPQGLQAPIQSYLTVEAFEVRHEILVRLRDLDDVLDLAAGGIIEIAEQAATRSRLEELVVPLTAMSIDGVSVEPVVERIDFLSVSAQGVLPRAQPVIERVEEAWTGVTLSAVTPRTPQEVALVWKSFPPGAREIPATVADPETSQTMTLTVEQPDLTWRNNLTEDPAPVVKAVAIEPRRLALPLVALPLFVAVGLFLVRAVRERGPALSFATARVTLSLALVVAPIGQVAVALPRVGGSTPTEGQARRILAGVLPNVYRAFEFREEAAVYDRLAVSVVGETLTDIYLEHRRALEMEERGGLRARVEAVEVPEVRSVRAAEAGGFEADAIWLVGGTVTHFGHRHFRQNRYDARVAMVAVDNTWKIRSIELFDEERVR